MAIIQGTVEVQDFTLVGNVGDSNQQQAGHIYEYADLDSKLSNFSTLAYYKFASGALTTDETGTYTLTNNNAAINAVGILNTNYATALDGVNQYYSQPTLFDSPSTLSNGIFVGFWVKLDDGQPGVTSNFFSKVNDETGASEDYITIDYTTGGVIRIQIAVSGTVYTLPFTTVFPNGSTDWVFIAVNHDTTNGIRGWINGNQEIEEGLATTLMSDGTTRDFSIGANLFGGASGYMDGTIAQVIVADAIVTQRDIDFMMATLIPEPTFLQGRNYSLIEKIQPEADTDYEYQEPCHVLTKYNGNIYKYAYSNDPLDKVNIIARME